MESVSLAFCFHWGCFETFDFLCEKGWIGGFAERVVLRLFGSGHGDVILLLRYRCFVLLFLMSIDLSKYTGSLCVEVFVNWRFCHMWDAFSCSVA